jgi:ribosome modulation factor
MTDVGRKIFSNHGLAWTSGYAARLARDVKLEDNPYPETNLYDRDMWALGWREADHEAITADPSRRSPLPDRPYPRI